MTTPQTSPGSELAAPGVFPRVTQVALILNAIAHGTACVGWVLGFGPHSADETILGRRAAAAGFAAIVMFALVARRLRRDPSLILLPLAFVFFNLSDTVAEFVIRHDKADLPPVIPESLFLVIYSIFALRFARPRPKTV
jgi:hypothetical protein